MGSMPWNEVSLHHILSTNPRSIKWTTQRKVIIWKRNKDSIGIKIEVYEDQENSYVIITKVKEECDLQYGDNLQIFDRIIKINDTDITSLNKQEVHTFIHHCKQYHSIVVHVCSPVKVLGQKRPSDQSYEENMGKVKGDKSTGKRLAKSNSVDSSEKKEPNESDALLSGDGPPSGDSNPCLTCGIGAIAENERTQSLPLTDNLVRLNLEEDRIQSMPMTSHPCSRNGQGMCIHDHSQSNDGNVNAWTGTGLKKLDCNSWKRLQMIGPAVVLKFPHIVKWDPNTKVVTLHRGNKGTFGFTYKVKAAKNADDLFTLVENVVPEGPAAGHLMVGDWIRSVNGRPLQTPKEALGITSLIKEATELRIVLQRPDLDDMPTQNFTGASPISLYPELHVLSEGAAGIPLDSVTVGNLTERSPIFKKVPYDRQSSMSSLTYDRQNSASSMTSLIPKPGNAESKKPIFTPRSTDAGRETKSDMFRARKSPDQQDSGLKTPDSNTDNTAIENLDTIQISLLDVQSPQNSQLNKTVNLPKVRVFICGSEARSLARLILPESLNPSNQTDISNRKYMCLKCTMGMDRQGKISFTPWSAFDHLLQDSGDMTSLHASSDSLAQLAREQEDSSTFLHKGFVNMEFFIVPDEKFFHHCCQYLFTRTSLFMLTFDGDKMINSAAGEMSRLENMIHTIRCFVGYECQILTYGLVGSDQVDVASSVTVDEVQTLFYTAYGNQLQKYSVAMPFIFNSSADQNTSYADVCRQLQNSIWKTVSDTVQKQHVLMASLAVLQQLELYKRKGQTMITEDDFRNIFKRVAPNGEQDLQQMVSVDLKDYGVILSSKLAPLSRSSSQCLDSLMFIEPEILLASIQNLILVPPELIKNCESTKQKYFRLIDTGIISQEDLVSLCSNSINGIEKMIELLEIYGLIFRQEIDQDGKIHVSYFVPYFIQEQTITDSPKPDCSDLCLYIQFTTHMSKHISSMQFYHLSNCINNASHSKDIVVSGSASCVVHHHGFKITMFHQKLYDRIQIILTRSEHACKPCKILHWLSGLCHSTFGSEKYVLGPACPLQDSCNVISKNSTDIHILDLSRGEHVKCGEARIDNHKHVRIWASDNNPPNTYLDPNQAGQKSHPLHRSKSETASTASLKSENVPPPQVYINDLPYSVFHSVCLHLQMKNGHDWRDLAGIMGMSVERILLYETQPNPAQQLLLDLGRSHRLTIDRLVEILSQPEMGRLDIVDVIKK